MASYKSINPIKWNGINIIQNFQFKTGRKCVILFQKGTHIKMPNTYKKMFSCQRGQYKLSRLFNNEKQFIPNINGWLKWPEFNVVVLRNILLLDSYLRKYSSISPRFLLYKSSSEPQMKNSHSIENQSQKFTHRRKFTPCMLWF